MAILIDPPRDYHGRFKRCSHMFSDISGSEGSAELLAFARQIGMQAKWLQKPGTRHEHFDVFGARRPRAVAAGAREVSAKEAVAVWKRKGEEMKATGGE